MAFTISDVKADLEGMVHSTSLNKIQNLNALMRRAALKMLTEINPDATKRKQQITGAVHDDLYDYSAPDDLKGRAVIDIRPQANRDLRDNTSQRLAEEFDLKKSNNTFHIRELDGEKSLRLSKNISPSPTTMHNMDSITDNGTWGVVGDAENLERDTLKYISGSASLKFDLDGSGTSGAIRILDMDEIDLSDEEDEGQFFVRVYIPDPDIVTNVKLRWGSDGSNYWEGTATSPHDADSFKTGWNIISFDWDDASETSSPDSETIDSLRVTITYDGTADTDFRVDKISYSLGEIWEIVYYSKYPFQSSSETWKAETSSDSDILNFGEGSYNIFLHECLLAASQQNQGEDAVFDRDVALAELTRLYPAYENKHPDEAIKPTSHYWDYRTYA